MSLSKLPNELVTQITRLLSTNDQKNCMSVNREWHSVFQASVLHSVHFKTAQQFDSFYEQLQKTQKVQDHPGVVVRKLMVNYDIDLTLKLFELLPDYCPYLEYIDFNPLSWQEFENANNLEKWQFIQRFPTMTKASITVPLLQQLGSNITHLEFDKILVDELSNTQLSSISVLSYTPNLKLLRLEDGEKTKQVMSVPEFESIHTLCPHLEALYLEGFGCKFSDDLILDIDTLPIATKVKDLRLIMSINSEKFLSYWTHKYPNTKILDLQLRRMSERYPVVVQPRSTQMNEKFIMMAKEFSQLKKLHAVFNERHFPWDIFLRGLNERNTVQLQELVISFHYDSQLRTSYNFKLLLNRSCTTITRIALRNWDRNWNFDSDILQPISQCSNLEELSITPGFDQLTEFYIDRILDACPNIRKLELAKIIHLIHRKTRVTILHTRLKAWYYDALQRLIISSITWLRDVPI